MFPDSPLLPEGRCDSWILGSSVIRQIHPWWPGVGGYWACIKTSLHLTLDARYSRSSRAKSQDSSAVYLFGTAYHVIRTAAAGITIVYTMSWSIFFCFGSPGTSLCPCQSPRGKSNVLQAHPNLESGHQSRHLLLL